MLLLIEQTNLRLLSLWSAKVSGSYILKRNVYSKSFKSGVIDSRAEIFPKVNNVKQEEVNQLQHQLNTVLNNNRFKFLRDPTTQEFNWDEYLSKVTPVDDFNYGLLSKFYPPSKDTALKKAGHETNSKFAGSTSSLTGLLSQIHFFLSKWKPPSFLGLSKKFRVAKNEQHYTRLCRSPSSVHLSYQNGLYCIDRDHSLSSKTNENTILMSIGKSLEAFFTLEKEDYGRYLKNENLPEKPKPQIDVFQYSKCRSLLIRSQLDCFDKALPNSGVFDLKTRAVLGVRLNQTQPEVYDSYTLDKYYGNFARLGRMEGVFVAYHNTCQIFGFQFVSLKKMDKAIHWGRNIGDAEFKLSIQLLESILQYASSKFPKQSIRLMFSTQENTKNPALQVFVEAVPDNENHKFNPANLEEVNLSEPVNNYNRFYAFQVRVTNYVNGKRRFFIQKLRKDDKWTIRYKIYPVFNQRAMFKEYLLLRYNMMKGEIKPRVVPYRLLNWYYRKPKPRQTNSETPS
ncbi:RNA metabolism pathway protein Pet127 [Schizosaccharomyces cryophilus OY26]|uniref:RNA metabolism pathway protein Pet127 n=1 Tax=Schizosaccharomyces cryophilus (strain OY26 / ATCC MYA-4695 / CBS 11777 / NBRC 106824 / NRRL Y48691) TaxID=653667 RepID=S9WYY5_SCHCR|nr:RNA metabolism pathway protein Pet127 [Schizosaccharomyces cryophilus OY26]EPY49907.1 RNA metabolism pathway protein Pet127 [Schizosaccharomyces cryophilus OY26]